MLLSQTRLLTHSDGDVVVPIILSDQGHHRPIPGWVSGVDCEELFSAVLGEPVHLDGVAHSIGEKEHFNLGEEQTGLRREATLKNAAHHLPHPACLRSAHHG
uniref:Uncharacterized protein n=1 Tax=Equus caballus TaxID=9796 RepID=A0A9L0S3X3_HORSE